MLPPRYRKLLIALGAIAALLIARETGLDRGLLDAVMGGLVEVVVEPAPIEPEAAQ